jgi:hypothetical protein
MGALVVMCCLFLFIASISQKPSHQLSWSQCVELLKLDDELEGGGRKLGLVYVINPSLSRYSKGLTKPGSDDVYNHDSDDVMENHWRLIWKLIRS